MAKAKTAFVLTQYQEKGGVRILGVFGSKKQRKEALLKLTQANPFSFGFEEVPVGAVANLEIY